MLKSGDNMINNYPLKNLFKQFQSIIVIDTETSGLDFEKNRVIELAALKLKVEDNEIVVKNEMDYLIKLPEGVRLDPKITELTGISEEDLDREGVSASFAFSEFASLFSEEKILLIAYNAHFDLSFLYYSLLRENLCHILRKIQMLDALTVYKDRRAYPHKLENAILEYNLEGKVVNSHRAIDDTKALVEVLKAMDEENPDLLKYINLFGYNPKYGVQGLKIGSVKYLPQPYNNPKKLYE
jgi:DNA polymerase III epsilon subunit-like protein